MRDRKPKIVIIVGATATGKTNLSIEVAKHFGGEIVSADSRQAYRGMDVGTAKAVPKSKIKDQKSKIYSVEGISHYLVNIKDPCEEYTVAQFKRDAIAAIEEILKKGKLPILVGGTGLYICAVVDNWEIPEVKANPKLRQELENKIKEKGLKAVFDELVALDPEAAYVVDPKNPRRVIRALEVAIATQKPFTASRIRGAPLFDALKIGIDVPKEILRERINARVNEMIRDGLVEEVQNLIKKFGRDCTAFDAIGYREIIEHLDGKTSLGEATELIKKNTWAYARRQMTWFRKDKEIQWIQNKNEAAEKVEKFLNDKLSRGE